MIKPIRPRQAMPFILLPLSFLIPPCILFGGAWVVKKKLAREVFLLTEFTGRDSIVLTFFCFILLNFKESKSHEG
jgi:hypothetical protein